MAGGGYAGIPLQGDFEFVSGPVLVDHGASRRALDADDLFVHREITKCANDWFIRSYELSISRII